MSPDQSAQLKQLRADAKALRVTISSIRGAGADQKLIDQARWELYFVEKLVIESMPKEKLQSHATIAKERNNE